MDTIETLRHDLDRLQETIDKMKYVPQQVFEQAIVHMSEKHEALLKRFDTFVDETKSHGAILKIYMENVNKIGDSLKILTASVQKIEVTNSLVHDKLTYVSPIKQFLNEYKGFIVAALGALTILCIFIPETISGLIDKVLEAWLGAHKSH